MSFVSAVCRYVMFEVLEIMWGALVKDVKAARGLSDLIAAHDRYLVGILQKVRTNWCGIIDVIAQCLHGLGFLLWARAERKCQDAHNVC